MPMLGEEAYVLSKKYTDKRLLESGIKIYGAKFSGSTAAGVRTHDAVGMVAGVGVDNQPAVNDFDNIDLFNRPRCNIYHDAQGNPIVMAYEGEPGFNLEGAVFPPYADMASVFYECKPCAWNGSFDEPQVTGTPREGFELFECFSDWNTPIYLPSYWMAMKDNKAVSISGTFPSQGSLNDHMTNARTYHDNAHTETMAAHMYEYVLQLVEFATRDVQTIMMGASNNRYNEDDTISTVESDTVFTTTAAIGALFVAGQTICIGSAKNGENRTASVVIESIVTDGSVSTFTLRSPVPTMAQGDYLSTRAWINGATDIIVASSGSLVSNMDGKHPCIWRGKVDPWANAFSSICDILIERTGEDTAEAPYVYTPHYLTDPTKYSSGEITADYIKLNLSLPGTDGYAKSLAVDKRFKSIGLTDGLGASNATYYLAAYYYYPRYAVCVVSVGGLWNSGRLCSPVFFSCFFAPSDSLFYRLARLSVTRT